MTQQKKTSQPAKKQTAKAQAASKGATQPHDRQPKAKSNGKNDGQLFRIHYQGRSYEVGRKDLTDQEARLFRREMGSSLASALADPDLDVFVALVWLIDRRDDPSLSLDDYAGTFNYADVEDQVDIG